MPLRGKPDAPLKGKAETISQSDSGLNETGDHLAKDWDAKATLVYVPIDDIRPSPNNARKLDITLEMLSNPESIDDPAMREEAEYINDLALTIRDHGQLQPGLGFRVGSGLIELMAGERRWWACQLAGLDEMQIMVYPEKPSGNATRHLIENVHRRNLTASAMLRGLLNIMDEREAAGSPILSGVELQETVRIPKTQAYRWWSVITGPSDLRDAVLRDQVPNITIAEQLSKLHGHERKQRIESQDFEDMMPQRRTAARTAQPHVEPAPAPKRKKGRPPSHVNMGRAHSGEVVKTLVSRIDPEGDYSRIDWSDFNQAGKVWRNLLNRMHDEQQ